MTSIYQMVSVQPGIIPQITGDLTHTRFWVSNVLVDHYYDYCYTHLMRLTSAEETLQAKDSYNRFVATHGARFCAYRADRRRFA